MGPRDAESPPAAGLAVHEAWSPGSSRSSRGGQSSRVRAEPLLTPRLPLAPQAYLLLEEDIRDLAASSDYR